jgi:thiamine pyrophosphate-dependent acetolactate synthase large subunit-like protein
MRNMNARTEIAGGWMSYGYNRIKGRAASACLFNCVGILHASPVALAAKTDSTPLGFQPTLGVTADAKIILEQLTEAVETTKTPVTSPDAAEARREQVAQGQREWLEYLGALSEDGGINLRRLYRSCRNRSSISNSH